MAFSPSTLCAMGGNLWRGLWVLGAELAWVFGRDVSLGRQVRVLRGRRKALLAQLAARDTQQPALLEPAPLEPAAQTASTAAPAQDASAPLQTAQPARAEPGAAGLDPAQDELALLEQDLAVAEAERNTAHAAHLAPLRRRFPAAFA